MYAPHSVTLYNACKDGELCITFLERVLLDVSLGGNVGKNGVASSDAAVLFVPFDCSAVDAVTGQKQTFCMPGEFDRLEMRSGVWTAGPRDKRAAVDCFFVRGRVVETDLDFAAFHDRYDGVFRVSSLDVRDFGSPEMRHWQIGGV